MTVMASLAVFLGLSGKQSQSEVAVGRKEAPQFIGHTANSRACPIESRESAQCGIRTGTCCENHRLPARTCADGHRIGEHSIWCCSPPRIGGYPRGLGLLSPNRAFHAISPVLFRSIVSNCRQGGFVCGAGRARTSGFPPRLTRGFPIHDERRAIRAVVAEGDICFGIIADTRPNLRRRRHPDAAAFAEGSAA